MKAKVRLNRQLRASALVAGACLVFFLHGCSTARTEPDNSLYERLGGHPVVSAVVADVVDRTAANPRSQQSFDEVNLKNLKQSIVEQICSLTGGPCTYGGDDMQTAHKGLNISDGEFNILAEELREALDAHGVGTREKNELLRILAPMKRDIVTR